MANLVLISKLMVTNSLDSDLDDHKKHLSVPELDVEQQQRVEDLEKEK